MPPLGGTAFPTNRQDLQAALTQGLAGAFQFPPGPSPVELLGDDYPAFRVLRINLTNAAARENYKPSPPTAPRQAGIRVDELHIAGTPLRYAQAAISFELAARETVLDFARDQGGNLVLFPVAAQHGSLRVRIDRPNLDALARALVTRAAEEYEVDIEKVELQLTSTSSRSATAAWRVTAKKKVFVATVRTELHGTGQVVIDDALNATLSNLTAEGEGMIGTLVVGMLRHELNRLEGRAFPLMAFPLGSIKLRDLHIDCSAGLQIDAAFGS